jgi:hypothetical protein
LEFAWQRDEEKKLTTTGTHDLLLYRDIIEAMIYASFEDGRLLGDSDRVRERLAQTSWRGGPRTGSDDPRDNRVRNPLVHDDPDLAEHRLFDNSGDRRPGTGEHIVRLRPNFSGDRLVLPQPCTISVWRFVPGGPPTWYEIDRHNPPYNQSGG